MYAIIEDEYLARVPPTMLGEDYDLVVEEVTRRELQGTMVDYIPVQPVKNENQKCYIVSILGVKKNGDGIMVHGDGGVYQKISYRALAFVPKVNEIVEGFVVSIVSKIGAFIRFGSFEGLLHIGQIMDDRIEINEANRTLSGKDSKKELKVGDKVRVRIVMMSISSSSPKDRRIGFTMKQPGLGKLEWIGSPIKQDSGKLEKEIPGNIKSSKIKSPKRNSAKSSSEVEFVHETVENIPKPVDEETQEEEALGEEHDYGEEL